jgi:hypothetical protein
MSVLSGLSNVGSLFEAAGGASSAGGAMGFWPSLALGLTLSGVGQLMSMAGEEEPKAPDRQHKELFNRQTAASNMLSGGGPKAMGGVPISRGGSVRESWAQGSSLPG